MKIQMKVVEIVNHSRTMVTEEGEEVSEIFQQYVRFHAVGMDGAISLTLTNPSDFDTYQVDGIYEMTL